MTTHHPIAIVGGGLGGLTTARVLHVHDIPATIFELEPDREARVQGGMLDIHRDTGQQAVRASRLWDHFTGLIHPGGEAMRILDGHGAVLRDQSDPGDLQRPEVDRGQLRTMLLDSLPSHSMHWGRKVTSVEAVTDGLPGRWHVHFADGDDITTDLLVGADGAWSKVRPLLTDARPTYAGISFVEVDLFDGATRHPAEAEAVGDGMLFAFQGDTGILAHLETDASLHVYLGLRVTEDWIDTVDWTDTDHAKSIVLEQLAGWADPLRGLIAHADTGLTPRRIHALPVGLRWPRIPGVTLLGDAAHLMSPFAGEGANLAMFDGSQLAESIAAHPTDHERALGAYENTLFPRSEESAATSAGSLEMLFSEDSPRGLVEMFAGFDDARASQTLQGQS